MAINDVSLTAGMRSNLLSLQNTVSLLDRTQNRLSSGKKVNTAMDNPVSFFAAQALNSRASVIDSLKDAMGQAVQTITAADKGITAISAMIEQAKGLAQSALSTERELDVAAVPGVTTVTFGAIADNDTLTVDGEAFTALSVGAAAADGTFADAAGLAAAINANTTLTGAGYSAAVDGANVVITSTSEAIVATPSANMTATVTTAYAAAATVANPEFTSIQSQYNTLLTQITELSEDSGYKGKNLLNDDNLTVKFEGADLSVEGFSATAGGLGITVAAWTSEAAIDTSVTQLDGALTTLRSESSKMSGNLSIISVRQDFSTNMINTLTAGSDKLTLADANEEGANMLMLQTRQSLSTTALSMSAQAAQSVLRLFQ